MVKERFTVLIEPKLLEAYRLLCDEESTQMSRDIGNFMRQRVAEKQKGRARIEPTREQGRKRK
jgi:hypothetical protein